MTFTVHNVQTAPQESAALLEKIEQEKGYVPNLAGVLAEAPAALNAFLQLEDGMRQTSFTAQERDIILLAASHENNSEYCEAAHTQQAEKHGLTSDMAEAVKAAQPLSDKNLEALRQYTLAVMQQKGRPEDHVIEDFLQAGYKPQQALEIVLGITLKTLTNYTYRLAHPDIDPSLRLSPDRRPHDKHAEAS